MRRPTFGQALVEFALIFPLLLAVMLAIVDGAFLFQGYITVSHAAHEAARFAVVYRPVQGQCLNRDAAGGPISEPWPYCPVDWYENPSESDSDYYDRRVALIKLTALEAAEGLQTQEKCTTASCIQNHVTDPGMLGIRVWGFQSFEGTEEEDMPGLPGLPVRVQVIHNVPLVIYGAFLPNAMVQVTSATEMINEGIQVGFGNQPPPTFSAAPNPNPPDPSAPTNTPAPTPTLGPSPTPTLIPVYHISLTPKDAVNMLPDEREHALTAHVTDDLGHNVAGASVTFDTTEGSYDASGATEKSRVVTTDADGNARAVIFANEPVTASIRAWLDYDYDTTVDAIEPNDTARKIWQASGAYLIVSDHNPEPQQWLGVSALNHPQTRSPISLWWCPSAVSITTTAVMEEIATGITLDASGNHMDIPVQVPLGVAGTYRIESHEDGAGDACGNAATLLAYSADIAIAEVPPDLIIEAVSFVDAESIVPGGPITLNITVTNASPIVVNTGLFDLDTYLDLGKPPYLQQLGENKRWLPAGGTLAPYASEMITTIVTIYTVEDHELWFQVDTTDYVDEGTEGGEDNNIFGPLPIPLETCIPIPEQSDDFDGGLNAPWQTVNLGNANGSYSTAGGQLSLTSRGRQIWNGTNHYYFMYQQITGDFDARVRIIAEPTNNEWAQVGLHVAQSLDRDTRYALNVATHFRSPAAELAGYRNDWSGTASLASGSSMQTIGQPSWLRIKRIGNTYEFFRSDAADPTTEADWISQGTFTATRDFGYLGIVHASYQDGTYSTGTVDDFEVCRPVDITSVDPPPADVIYPPGLVQCEELIRVPGFEGNPATIFEYWHAGDGGGLVGAFQRTSAEFYRGSFSMRLHASNSVLPCSANQLQPYLYQEIALPTEVFSHSTLIVSASYLPKPSTLTCSWGGAADSDDSLGVGLRQTDGTVIVPRQPIMVGNDPTTTWKRVSVNLHETMSDPTIYAGQTVRLQWEAANDMDEFGSFFYIDEVSAQLCTEWATPTQDPAMATIGGTVTTRSENNVPTAIPGTDVWAYSQGTQVHHTQSIHDGTYHFYNVEPGAYIIYAEAWVGGELRTVSTSVTVSAGDSRTDINLLLQ